MSSITDLIPHVSPVARNILGVALASGLGFVALTKLKSRAQSRAKPKRLPKRKVNGAGKSSCVDLVAGFDLDAEVLGNKAYHLTNLKALNHNVPSAFVVTSVVYENHIQRCNCDDLIASLADASLSDVLVEENCRKIREKIMSTEVAPDLLTECQQFLSKLEGPLGVAVRSSSNQEDSQGKAFAGQFETHLNVTKNAKDVTDKIKHVWASLWAPHVILYRRKMTANGPSALPTMSVLVQEMVDSAVSGVIFSANPFGMFTEAMIESYFGQGESLVSGEISPDQFVINRSDRKIVKQSVNVHKKYATYANEHGGLVKTELAPSLATSPSLTASQINQIVDLALDVENEFDAPQDIEFALDKSGKIFLLQARPITTGTKKYSFLTEWKPPGPGIWTKENAHVPTPVTKLYGIAMSKNIVEGMRYSSAQMCSPLETIDQKVVNGFVYTSPRSVGAPPSANGPPPKWIFKALVRIHPTLRKRLGGIENVYKTKAWRKSMEFWLTEDRTNRINQTVALSSVDVTALSDNELLAHFKKCFEHWGLMIRHHHVYTFTSVTAVGDYLVHLKKWGIELIDGMQLLSGLDSISYGVETFAVDDVYKAFKEDAEALRILKNSEEKPEVVLEQLRSRSGRVKEALKKYTLLAGFRPSKGYDIDQPTVQEVPQLFLEGLRKTYDYGAKEFVIHPASQEEINAVRNRVPEKDRAQFDDLLAEAQYMYPLRDERAMYCDLLSGGAVRFAVLEIGKRLVQKKILPRAELAINASDEELTLMMTKPNTDHSALVATLQEWEEYRRTIDPGTVPEFLGGTPAEPPPADWFPDPYSRRMMEAVSLVVPMVLGSGRPNPAGQALEDKKVIGTSGSRGVVEGRVKIVKSLATDQHKFEKGDILVTYCTSSSFCLLLSQSAAVITEEGGALSHAAITARELHIPAVVAARNATQVLQDGMLVRVDGNTGIVQIL